MSLDELTHALRSPGRAGEVADVGLVTPLITAALAGPAPTVEGHGEVGAGLVLAPAAPTGPTAGDAAAAELPMGGLSEPSLTVLLGLESAAAVSSQVVPPTAVHTATASPSRSARVGIGAGVWLVALGGVGTAAAMTGLITAAVDGLFGGHGPPLVTAQGPERPGTPATSNPPAQPGQGTRPGSTGRPSTAAEPPAARGGGSQSVSLPGSSRTTEIVLASFVTPVTSTPSTPANTPSTPTTPGTPGSPTTPSTPPVTQPPAGGPVVSGGNGHGATQGRKATRPARVAARATAKAARLAAKASARAHHQGKAVRPVKTTGHAHAKANGKALGHDKTKAQGQAVGHGNV